MHRDLCGWNTGTARSGPSRCGALSKASTNHPYTDNGRVCGKHIRSARSDRNRPIAVVYAVKPDKPTDGCSKCGALTLAEHHANIDAFGSPHVFGGNPADLNAQKGQQ